MVWFYEQAKTIIQLIARGVEFAAAVIIALAAIEATIKAALIFVRRNSPGTAKNEVRMTLGRWLAVALEFELAADILNTAVTPTWSDIEKLAAIAALRTALNYFLEREIRAETAPVQRAAEQELKRSDAIHI
jgi:uncharacterized membrane protein